MPRKRNKKYSPELKTAAAEAYLAGEGSLREICRKFEVSAKNIWKRSSRTRKWRLNCKKVLRIRDEYVYTCAIQPIRSSGSAVDFIAAVG